MAGRKMTATIDGTPYADLRSLQVYDSPKRMVVVDQWHKHFLWEPHTRKRYHLNDRDHYTTASVPHFPYSSFAASFYDEWCGDVGNLSDSGPGLDTNLYAHAVVMYKRTVESPLLNELAQLQELCEKCVDDMATADFEARELTSGLKGFFAKNREKAAVLARQVERQYEEFDQLMEQVEIVKQRIKNGE